VVELVVNVEELDALPLRDLLQTATSLGLPVGLGSLEEVLRALRSAVAP